jgi:hypothetical protein
VSIIRQIVREELAAMLGAGTTIRVARGAVHVGPTADVLRVVGELGEAHPRDVAEKLGRDTQTTANLMGTLLRRGELRRARRGVYALARKRGAA